MNGIWAEVGLNDQFNYKHLKAQIQAKCKTYFKQFKQSKQYQNLQYLLEKDSIINQMSIILTDEEMKQRKQEQQQKEQQEQQLKIQEIDEQESEDEKLILNITKQNKIPDINVEIPQAEMINAETQYTPRSNVYEEPQNVELLYINHQKVEQEKQSEQVPQISQLSQIQQISQIQKQQQQQQQQIEQQHHEQDSELTKDQLEPQQEQEEQPIRQFNLKQLQNEMKIKLAKQMEQQCKPGASRLGLRYLNKEFTPSITKHHEPVIKDEELMKRIENYKVMSSRKFVQSQRYQEDELKATVEKIILQQTGTQDTIQLNEKSKRDVNELQKIREKYDATITIDYNNKQYELAIKKNDDPLERAKLFCDAVSIPQSKASKIAVIISQQIQKLIRQEQLQNQELTQQDLLQNQQAKPDAIFQISVKNKVYDIPYVHGQKPDILAQVLCQNYNINYDQYKHTIIQQISEMIRMFNQNE